MVPSAFFTAWVAPVLNTGAGAWLIVVSPIWPILMLPPAEMVGLFLPGVSGAGGGFCVICALASPEAVQLLLGHTKIESTVRYLGIEVEDALAIAEQVDV